MASVALDRAVQRRCRHVLSAFGEDVRRLREDAGVSRAELARSVGVDDSYLGRIEAGRAAPSIETCARISLGLGADLSWRLYPNTGPALRDRHQANILEALLAITHPRWQRFIEVAVRRPSRGWIDAGFYAPAASVFVATEIQSDLRRLEQLIRWSEAKAASVPSWDGWDHLGSTPEISRLLVVRDTRATRQVVHEFRRLLRGAYPADASDALASLSGAAPWPGPALLWAVRQEGAGEHYRIAARAW